MIVAIDGPAASGKGTLARRLARHFGYAYLDTGALYRAVGFAVLQAGGDPADPEAAVAAARSLDPTLLDDPRLRTDDIAQAASKVAAIPAVRAALLEFQRAFAKAPPTARRGRCWMGGTLELSSAPMLIERCLSPRRWRFAPNADSRSCAKRAMRL